jgi:hypothetical protein
MPKRESRNGKRSDPAYRCKRLGDTPGRPLHIPCTLPNGREPDSEQVCIVATLLLLDSAHMPANTKTAK